MFVRYSCMFLVVAASLAQAGPAHAQFLKKICHSIVLDTKRNNCWPIPFVTPERQAVRAPIQMMVQQGWQRQNLLGDYHFDEQTGKLTEAGELKVRWIASQIPQQHRVIFVSRAASPQETAARVAGVQNVAGQAQHEGGLPRVLESDLAPGGWPAGRVDAIGRKFEEVMPEPKLPDSSTGSAD